MKGMKLYKRAFSPVPHPWSLVPILFLCSLFTVDASPLHSATWGFRLDLPEGYEYIDGNNLDRYSFQGPNGAMFDIAVYSGVYQGVEQMANDISRRLSSSGDTALFEYAGKTAALMDLHFRNFSGWGLCLELT
jgi:hypothetical protein